jgi:adenine phosphoribosyltransferase
LRRFIRDVPDFPTPGILFRDITPLLASPEAFRAAVDAMVAPFRDARAGKVVGIEARGFMFGAVVARELGLGFVPARKPGKLPGKTEKVAYGLEYGSDALEVHADA